MFRRITMSLAMFGLGMMPTIVSAQAAPRAPAAAPARPAEAARPANHSQPNAADAFFARWLIIDNQNEIELAKLAEQKSEDSQVKEFAQQMIQDHQRMIDQLNRFVGETGEPRASTAPASTPAASTAPATAQPRAIEQPGNVNNRVRTEVTREPARAPAGQGTPERRTVARVTDEGLIPGQANPQTGMLALKQELAEQCRNSARQELDGKDGKEFDECFIGMQLAGHMMAIDTMKVFERHASEALQHTIAGGVKTAEGHFAMAKKIMHQQTDQQSKSEK